MTPDKQASIIKVAAIVVAMPRWIGALLEAEGVPLPVEWQPAWRVFSLIMSAGMAIVEAMAFSFILQAWRDEKDDRRSKRLMSMIILSAVAFIAVLSPYVYSMVKRIPMADVLSEMSLWGWSIAVASSTILIVMSIGYAQRTPREKKQSTSVSVESTQSAQSIPDYETYTRFCEARNGDGAISVAELMDKYGVPRSSAYKWYGQYAKTHPVKESITGG